MTTPGSPRAERRKRIVIVGGGITGLAAANRIRELAPDGDAEVILLEGSDRVGGKIRTHLLDTEAGRFVVEGGPDSLLTTKPWGLQLAERLGLRERMQPVSQASKTVWIVRDGKLVQMPEGVALTVPTRLMPMVRSRLFSARGKARMGLDLVRPARRDGADESVGAFVRRRLGDEAVDWLAEPLLAGIYSSDVERQSILATFPQFRETEARHGSLVRGMRAARRNAPPPTDPPKPVFVSFRHGLEEIPAALEGRLGHLILRQVRALSVIPGAERQWAVRTEGAGTIEADAVIVATPAAEAARLLRDIAPAAADGISAIRTVSTGTIAIAYRTADLPPLPPGSGLLVPTAERRPINAVTVVSAKWEGRAPSGWTLLRVFFGGARSAQTWELDDEQVMRVAREELQALLGITAAPLFERVERWPDANPQYDVGHLDRVARIEAGLPLGLFVAGAPYRGVGIPDCIRQGEVAAEGALAATGIAAS